MQLLKIYSKEFSINKLPLKQDEINILSETQDLLVAIGANHFSDDFKGAYIKLMNALQLSDKPKNNKLPYVFSQKAKQKFGFGHSYCFCNEHGLSSIRSLFLLCQKCPMYPEHKHHPKWIEHPKTRYYLV